MKHHRTILLAVTTLIASALSAGEPVTLKLDSFTDLKGSTPGAAWVTESDGSIHLAGKGGGNLISKNEYESFEVEWEWKLSSGGNNGLKYWVTAVGDKKEWLGIEYQMIDDHKHPDGLKGGSHTTACIYDIKEASADKPLKPIGEWNLSKVVVKKGSLLNSTAIQRNTKSESQKANSRARQALLQERVASC
jgi:hypothetical protein